MLKLTAATALIQHSLRLFNIQLGKFTAHDISLTHHKKILLKAKNETWSQFGRNGGEIFTACLDRSKWIGAKGEKQQLAATVITTFAPISPRKILPTLPGKIVRKLRGNKSNLGSTALCSVDPLTCCAHSGPSQLGEISDFICQNICLTQIIIFLANFDAV